MPFVGSRFIKRHRLRVSIRIEDVENILRIIGVGRIDGDGLNTSSVLDLELGLGLIFII